MSSPAVRRRPPRRMIFFTLRSIDRLRSPYNEPPPYNVPGVIRFTFVNGPPVNGRPICCAIAVPNPSVAVNVRFAGSDPASWSVLALFGVPLRIGRSRYTPLINTSILGTTYEARPLNDVWNGDSTWQY